MPSEGKQGKNVTLDTRVQHLEQTVTAQGVEIAHIKSTVNETAAGVKALLANDASRPTPTSMRTIVGTIAGIAASVAFIGAAVWWFIANAPAVQSLEKRITATEQREQVRDKEIVQRTTDRYTAPEAITNCLRNEIMNKHIGWQCANPDRGIPFFRPFDPTWTAQVKKRGS